MHSTRDISSKIKNGSEEEELRRRRIFWEEKIQKERKGGACINLGGVFFSFLYTKETKTKERT